MHKKILFALVLLLWSVSTLHAAGFEPGAFIRAVDKNGETIEGTIIGYDNNPEVSLLDKSGHYFKVHIKNAKRISGVAGQTVLTGGGTKLGVIKMDMTDGQSVTAGLNSNAIVKIDMGIKGQRTVWVTDAAKYQYVEVVDKTAGGRGDGFMKVKLINGEIISVPVKKSDIHSIIFE
jgi:hypothetical protein